MQLLKDSDISLFKRLLHPLLYPAGCIVPCIIVHRISHFAYQINLPTLSWKEEKRMCKLETELKDVLVEMAAIKGVEEALKKLEGN